MARPSAAIASEHPTPLRARRLATWRGGSHGRPQVTRQGCDSIWGRRCSSRRNRAAGRQVRVPGASGRGGVASRGRARRRRTARACRALGHRSGEARGRAPWPPAVGSAGGCGARAGRACTRPERGSRGSRARASASLQSGMHEVRYSTSWCRSRTC